MLSVGAESAVLTPDGPLLVMELQAGQEVLSLVDGAPCFVEVEKAVADQSGGEGGDYWICTDCGDVTVGGSASLVSAAGPVTGAYLWTSRNRQAIGWMEGEWPSVEVFVSHQEGTLGMSASWMTLVAKAARSLASIGLPERGLYRVGCHDEALLEAIGHEVIGGTCRYEQGPAGWGWLKFSGETRLPRAKATTPIHQYLLALWQRAVEPWTASLPSTETRLRSLTMCLMSATGVGYSTSYRPRYMPSFVDLRVTGTSVAHVGIQAVLEAQDVSLVALRLKKRSAYLVVNGILCAGS